MRLHPYFHGFLCLALGLPRLIAAADSTVASDAAQLDKMAARFAPTDITADVSKLSPNDRTVLVKLIEASKIIDGLFLRQVWNGNVPMLLDLARDQSATGNARLHYFRINKGPWSGLDKNAPFIPGVPPKPENASFYPDDSTKAEMEKWIASLAQEEQVKARGFFTVVRHGPDGKGFRIVPYNVEYQAELLQAATLLREGGAAATEPTLKQFLKTRADAFISNDYYPSDVAWMELKSTIE